jgi:hypothetical protein
MPALVSKLEVRKDGTILATSDKGSIKLPGDKKSAERHGGKNYWTSEEDPGYLKTKLLITAGTRVSDLNAIDGATLDVYTNLGHHYICISATLEETLEVSDGGQADATFLFEDAKEV